MPKFEPTDLSVEEIISKIKSNSKQDDAWKLLEIYKDIFKTNPQVWYPGIIGFGNFIYKTESGLEGDSPLLAFAPRQSNLTYILTGIFQKGKNILIT